MATSRAAYAAEKAVGHDDNAITAQDVSNPANRPEWGDPSETMKALCWMGKGKVEVCKSLLFTAQTNVLLILQQWMSPNLSFLRTETSF